MSQLQKGVYYVSIKVIGRLADKLDVEPDEFLKRMPKRVRANRAHQHASAGHSCHLEMSHKQVQVSHAPGARRGTSILGRPGSSRDLSGIK